VCDARFERIREIGKFSRGFFEKKIRENFSVLLTKLEGKEEAKSLADNVAFRRLIGSIGARIPNSNAQVIGEGDYYTKWQVKVVTLNYISEVLTVNN
jgi:hypothetical protein